MNSLLHFTTPTYLGKFSFFENVLTACNVFKSHWNIVAPVFRIATRVLYICYLLCLEINKVLFALYIFAEDQIFKDLLTDGRVKCRLLVLVVLASTLTLLFLAFIAFVLLLPRYYLWHSPSLFRSLLKHLTFDLMCTTFLIVYKCHGTGLSHSWVNNMNISPVSSVSRALVRSARDPEFEPRIGCTFFLLCGIHTNKQIDP